MVKNTRFIYLLFGVLTLGVIGLFQWSAQVEQSSQTISQSGIGNRAALVAAYERWKKQNYRKDKEHIVRLSLNSIQALSHEKSKAKGIATFNLITGEVEVNIVNLEQGNTYDVWLLNSNETTVSKERVHVGQLNTNANNATLQAQLNASDLTGFSMNQVMVTQLTQANDEIELLFGAPTLFQRLYYDEIRLQKHVAENNEMNNGNNRFLFSFLIPKPAFAQTAGSVDLTALIATGEDLFFNETFAGNGRTCGTCHRAENNFTIDPEFIATLPADDPLFVAEYDSNLEKLENPTLLRDYGLILANLDGLEDPENKFVMRSVSHTLGLSMSIQSSATEPPLEMTGWSGDGAPGGGTLRDFSTGAVVQHFTKSLDREEGVDFRLPTADELDALEAFMLSLGRQEDPDLNTLRLTDPNAERGRLLFLAEDSQNRTVQSAKCNICHRNAGALTVAGENGNFITGVENMAHPADLTEEPRPRDGGFGTQLNTTTGGFGDNAFNTPSLWEAADTAPYFHHNAASTLEEAIAFYDSNEFKQSIEGQRLLLMDTGGQEMAIEVDALAAFLRVINVLENIRSVNDYSSRAMGQSKSSADKLLKMAKFDVNDILQVLAEGELHTETWNNFENAKALLDSARGADIDSDRDGLISQAMDQIQIAKSFIVETVAVSDVQNPNVSILSPVASDSVSGLVTIDIAATDNVGIRAVDVHVDSVLLSSLSTAPFTFSWDSTLNGDGPVQIMVTATDTSGNSSSASVIVNVSNLAPAPVADTTAPTISSLLPTDGSVVNGTVMVSANVNDDIAVDNVVFLVDQVQQGVVTVAPYEIAWDSTTVIDGSHQLTVTAIDSSGNSTSVNAAFTVDNVVEQCTVYSCPNPPPPSSQPPPDQSMPIGSSPDGEFDGVLEAKDVAASTVTISTADGLLTLAITAETEFFGSIAGNLDDLLVGHVVQGEFFSSTNEVVWIEADLPPGL